MKTKLPTLYIAGPLFSESELRFNELLKSLLENYFNVYLPQVDGNLLSKLIEQGVPPKDAAAQIFKADMLALTNSDILLIILDGRSVDEGAAFELGVAYILGKECIGLQTDTRRLLPSGNNPMLTCALKLVFYSLDDLQSWAVNKPRMHIG